MAKDEYSAFRVTEDGRNVSCGLPREDFGHFFRDQNSDYPWTGVISGMIINSIWYWCADQVRSSSFSYSTKLICEQT